MYLKRNRFNFCTPRKKLLSLKGQSSPAIRHLVVQAMADWYMKGDQMDLSRILDVAQDLKVCF